jgi:hypothetical protein
MARTRKGEFLQKRGKGKGIKSWTWANFWLTLHIE